jgi:hypothetical protein
MTRVTRWRGSGRRSLPKISIFLVVLAGKAGKYHQKRRILGGLAALQTARLARATA